ncbi:MAG TPA: hypothetical protein VFQ45_01705 [Longimicrobium sp.]|nr:hypothetical protein [Longimicrobium sp.]
MASAKRTQDHDEIRKWVEKRGGVPAIVEGTGGLLRIDFIEGDGKEPRLEETGWEEWFRIFDDRGLTFLYQDEGDSRFFKLVRGDGDD